MLWCWLVAANSAAAASVPDFHSSYLSVIPGSTQTPVEVLVKFRTSFTLNETDVVSIQLPLFTSGDGSKAGGEDLESVDLSPSVYFEGSWVEGHGAPFTNSTLVLSVRPGVWIEKNVEIAVRIYKSAGIRVYCGFNHISETNDPFFLQTNATLGNGARVRIDDSDVVGSGCTKMLDCLSRGECDYCTERCMCYERLGDGDDVTRLRSIDCSLANCPVGVAWVDMPSPGSPNLRRHVECSNAGICETQRGECTCFDGFSGDACQRRVACSATRGGGGTSGEEGYCSGHGQCVTMRITASLDHALPLTQENYTYGTEGGNGSAWDADSIQHCVCDSAWETGLLADETQTPEYFEPDCSKRHCPSGNDPSTTGDETDCSNRTAPGGRGRGETGNKCHAECSNRGTCDYASGRCACFAGYYGAACDTLVKNAGVVDVP